MPEAGAIYGVDRGYVELCMPLCVAPSRPPSSSRVPSRTLMLIAGPISAPTERSTGLICEQIHGPGRLLHPSGLPRTSAAASELQGPRVRHDAGLPSPTTERIRPPPSEAIYKSRCHRWNSCFKWIKQQLRIKQIYGTSENAVKTQIWIAVSVYVLNRHRQEAHYDLGRLRSDSFVTDPIGDPLSRKPCAYYQARAVYRTQVQRFASNQPIELTRGVTGH